MNEKSLENLKQFKPGQSGNPAGRKPSRLKKFIKEYDLSKSDIDFIFKNLMFHYTRSELIALLKSKDGEKKLRKLPAGIEAFISGIIHDIKKGDARVTNTILDRIYGKASGEVNISGGLQLIEITKDEANVL